MSSIGYFPDIHGALKSYRSPICTEDLAGIDWPARPRSVTISAVRGRPVSPALQRTMKPSVLAEIERAILDQGWRYGVRSVTITFRVDSKRGLQLIAEIHYAA